MIDELTESAAQLTFEKLGEILMSEETLPTEEEFIDQLQGEIAKNSKALYQSFLASQKPVEANPFKESDEPLKTPEFVPEKGSYTRAEIEALADQMASREGQEKVALTLLNAAVKIGIAAIG